MTFKNKSEYVHYLKTREISLEKKVYRTDAHLKEKLGKEFEIIKLLMPLAENVQYEEWKIYFERFLPLMGKDVILIRNSLGGIFRAKYLSEQKLEKEILSTYFVCPPFDNTIEGEDLVNGFKLKSDISLLEKNSKNVYILFSEDDDVVPVSHADKYGESLTTAKIIKFKNKNGHFKISKFPEIVRMILKDLRFKS